MSWIRSKHFYFCTTFCRFCVGKKENILRSIGLRETEVHLFGLPICDEPVRLCDITRPLDQSISSGAIVGLLRTGSDHVPGLATLFSI